jgi:threonyl-tRNA synthetase
MVPAWKNEKDLKKYLTLLDEAEKRDHRKLAKEMDLFICKKRLLEWFSGMQKAGPYT